MAYTITTEMMTNAVSKTGRKLRSPQHPFNLRTLPWAIQPFLCAPVLAGETMKNLLLQSRVVSDPIKSPLIGWHNEYYFFYVKLRDLDERDDLTEMLMNPAYDASSLRTPKNELTGQRRDTDIDYYSMCLRRVVDEYFRDEGDDPSGITYGWDTSITLPSAKFATHSSFLDSAKLESEVSPTEGVDTPLGFEEPDHYILPGFEAQFAQYQHMRALKLTEATFEDYLASFGIKAPKADRVDHHRPELIRYVRDWTYPTNSVDASTGGVNSVVSWSVAERADKDRFFSEPGFIFGVTVARPKVYLGSKYNQAVSMLDSAQSWLPAVLSADPYTSLKRFTQDKGPLGHSAGVPRPSEAYWVDVRDLFIHGESFVNHSHDYLDRADTNALPLPDASIETKYASTAMARALFKTDNSYIRQDGVVSIGILGHQQDYT